MPYIKQEHRQELDKSIEQLVNTLKQDDKGIENLLGEINYCFSRIVANLMGNPSYNKVAMITGVLENIKQEFYRRIATPYEDKKIDENQDIPEYQQIFPKEFLNHFLKVE